MEAFEAFFYEVILEYLKGLDWRYIPLLIVSVELFNNWVPKDAKFFNVKFPAQYRVLAFGFIWAAFFFWVDDYPEKGEILIMFQSMVAAIALHTWGLKYILKLCKLVWKRLVAKIKKL